MRKALLTAVLFIPFATLSFATNHPVAKAVMDAVCAGKYSFDGKSYTCRVCPSFTSSGGSGGDFTIDAVYTGNFLPGRQAYVVSYWSMDCEIHAKNWGGYVLVIDGSLYAPQDNHHLGECRVVKGKDRDMLRCSSGGTWQGVTVSSVQICRLDERSMSLKCSTQKRR